MEREFIDRGPDLQVESAVALDHLKSYMHIEANKEAHVKGCKALDFAALKHIPVSFFNEEKPKIVHSRWARVRTGVSKARCLKKLRSQSKISGGTKKAKKRKYASISTLVAPPPTLTHAPPLGTKKKDMWQHHHPCTDNATDALHSESFGAVASRYAAAALFVCFWCTVWKNSE